MLNEIPKVESPEIRDPESNGFKEIKPENGMNVEKADELNNKQLDTNPDAGYYTSPKERCDQTPVNNGDWEGDRGESVFKPDGNSEASEKAKEKLAEYGLEGIEYKNMIPDFSECAEAKVQIEGMTENRDENFQKADIECAKKFNEQAKDGKTDWTPREVSDYRNREDNHLTWHEDNDTKTMYLVPTEIHEFFRHSGGVAECKKRDNIDGGDFDE